MNRAGFEVDEFGYSDNPKYLDHCLHLAVQKLTKDRYFEAAQLLIDCSRMSIHEDDKVALQLGNATTVSMTDLSGGQTKQLLEALKSAFPNVSSLRIMVKTGLGENLDVIAGATNLSEAVFNLVQWAEAQGRLEELVKKASHENPGNPALWRFIETHTAQEATHGQTILLHGTKHVSLTLHAPMNIVEAILREEHKVIDYSYGYGEVISLDEFDERQEKYPDAYVEDESIEFITKYPIRDAIKLGLAFVFGQNIVINNINILPEQTVSNDWRNDIQESIRSGDVQNQA